MGETATWATIWHAGRLEIASEGIIRHRSWSADCDKGKISRKGFVEQSVEAQRERSLLFDRIRNFPNRRITSKYIEFIEQRFNNPDTNLDVQTPVLQIGKKK